MVHNFQLFMSIYTKTKTQNLKNYRVFDKNFLESRFLTFAHERNGLFFRNSRNFSNLSSFKNSRTAVAFSEW